MRLLRLISALLLSQLAESVVSIFDAHGVLSDTVGLFLLGAAANNKIIFDPVLHIEKLFLK